MKFTKFLPTETNKKIDSRITLNESHLRLTRSMIYSKAFRQLSANAIRLYCSLKIKFHKELNNNDQFEVSKSLGTKLLGLSSNSEQSVKRALRILVKYGFLDCTFISKGGGKNHKQPNRFKFSGRWKEYK